MARFANSVLFTPAAGGTADFVVSAAVQGYMTPALAGAVTGVYKYRAESADLSQWEIGEGTYTSGTTTLTRTTVLYNSAGTGTAAGQSGAGTKINFTVAPTVGMGLQAVADTLEIENTGSFTTAQKNQARVNLEAFGTAEVATQADMETASSTTTVVTPLRHKFHPSAVKAWAITDGAASPVFVGYNVSSLTDNGTGDISFNFTTSFSSVNYAVAFAQQSGISYSTAAATRSIDVISRATGSVRIATGYWAGGGGGGIDMPIGVMCAGDQ